MCMRVNKQILLCHYLLQFPASMYQAPSVHTLRTPPQFRACCMQCAELSDKLAEDLASEGLRGRTITLKLKETNFELRTRDKTLPTHISSPQDIFREAMKLLKPELPIKIRLMVTTSPCCCMRCAEKTSLVT